MHRFPCGQRCFSGSNLHSALENISTNRSKKKVPKRKLLMEQTYMMLRTVPAFAGKTIVYERPFWVIVHPYQIKAKFMSNLSDHSPILVHKHI